MVPTRAFRRNAEVAAPVRQRQIIDVEELGGARLLV